MDFALAKKTDGTRQPLARVPLRILNLSKRANLGDWISYGISVLERRGEKAVRYDKLSEIIRSQHCRRILEIGTYDGDHARQMIESAKEGSAPSDVEYYGIDLFEELDDHRLESGWVPGLPPYDTVKAKLESTGVKVFLHKGDSRVVLPRILEALPKMDFVFIDGGHSLETIQSDWECVKRLMKRDTIVIFDDYWNRTDSGCKPLIDSLPRSEFKVEILVPQDRFLRRRGLLRINMVKVTKL